MQRNHTHLGVLVLLWTGDHTLIRQPHALTTHHCHSLSVESHSLLLLNHPWAHDGAGTTPWHHASDTLPHAHSCSHHSHACTCTIRSCHALLWPPGLGRTKLRWDVEPLSRLMLRRDACRHQVASHAHLLHPRHLLHALHPHARHPLDVLAGQVRLPVLLPLGQRHVERLGHDNSTIHLGHSFRGFIGGGETDEAKALTHTQ